jgi:diguanylate cyclase (GGDEF)-like protein
MQKPFVLIIEDERDIAALFRHVMDLAGYQTEIASNGTIALERLRHAQPDAVLLDLSLPDTSGARVLRSMRADVRLRNIPVVVITGHSEMTKDLDVEPDLVMLKPVSPVQLITLVERVCRRNAPVEAEPLEGTPWDEITGIYNRSFFLYRLDSALRSMRENGQQLFAVLSLSPDLYEEMRREQGEKPAEEFLRRIAESLKACVRPTDTLARFESDRFYLLIEQAPGLHIPEMIAARIQSRLQTPASGGLTCNIAVLLCDARYDDMEDILRDSTAAYALAHAAGRGSCLTFDHDSIQHDSKHP